MKKNIGNKENCYYGNNLPHLAAWECQSPLPVGPTTQRGAAGQQIEARYGLLLCDFTIPEVVGSQPALGHSGPASKRHHRQKVVQHPARACLQEGECGGILNVTHSVLNYKQGAKKNDFNIWLQSSAIMISLHINVPWIGAIFSQLQS